LTRLRIGLITSWNERCGISEYSRCLASALERRGHKLTILGNYAVRPVDWARDGPNVIRFFHTGWHPPHVVGVDHELARRVIAHRRLDVLHLQYQNTICREPFLELLPSIVGRTPLVVTFHDPTFPRPFPTEVVKTAVFHNEEARRLSSDLPWKHTEVIPSGVDDVPDPGREVARARLGIQGSPVIATVGSRTDHLTVLEAMSHLLPDYPDLVYLVAAPLELPPAVLEALQSGPLAPHTQVVIGFPPREDILLRLHAADACVLYYAEPGVPGTSSAAARLGLAARRPLVVSDVSLMNDLPPDLKIPPGDPGALATRLRTLLEDITFRERHLALQETLWTAYTWDQVAARHERLYERLAARRSRRSRTRVTMIPLSRTRAMNTHSRGGGLGGHRSVHVVRPDVRGGGIQPQSRPGHATTRPSSDHIRQLRR